MLREWTIGRKLTLGLLISVVAVVVVGFIGYRGTTRSAVAAESVAHTHAVRERLADLKAGIVDIETAVRGYIIAADSEFLMLAKKTREDLDQIFTSLKTLTRDNPLHQSRWIELRKHLDDRLAQLDDQVKNTAGATPSVEFSQRLTVTGRQTMLKIREIIAEANADEDRLLASRTQQYDEDTAMARILIIGGAILAAILALVIGFWISAAVSKQIGSAVQSVQSSSAELQAAANQQASSSAEQATAMNEIATTISELLATSRQIAESAQRVSQIATQTATSARGGESAVTKTNEAAIAVRKQVDQIVTHMLELGKRSQQLGSVLDLVGELAEQTNILAINASIEAAGAGDTGRRFGVVADEIRKLADRVGASTKEIRVLIEDVRGSVNTTVMATETGSKGVDAVIVQMGETASQFKGIASLVGTTTDAAREIELSTKQQATAIEQVNQAISNVAQAARETESSATQTLQTSGRLTELSNELARITESRRA
jgi:methyl-accepting chemotaxis protein